MSDNKNLHKAKKVKDDEFYTLIGDIEKECTHYKDCFKGKTVLCNCDDPYESNFYKFFFRKMRTFGIKRLICTSYGTSKVSGTQMRLDDFEDTSVPSRRRAYVLDISAGDFPEDDDNAIFQEGNELAFAKQHVRPLKGDGDFRSGECLEYLKQADVVVTNPPFSEFRDYISTLVSFGKQFLIIGNMNAITYKEVFPLIMQNRLWLGNNYVKEFVRPDGTASKMGNVLWYTNLPNRKRKEVLTLTESYSPERYPKYDNYDAIEVSKVADIPEDYLEEEYTVETEEELAELEARLKARGRIYKVERI